MTDEAKEALIEGFLGAENDAAAAAATAAVMSRQQQVTAATIEQTLRRAKKQRLEANPSLLEQQRKDVADLKSALSEEVGRWRAEATRAVEDAIGLASELVVPPKRSYAISKPLSASRQAASASVSRSTADPEDGEGPSYASWRASVEAIASAGSIFPRPRTLHYESLPPTAFMVKRVAGALHGARE